MNLELSFVKSRSIYGNSFNLISRDRFIVDANDADISKCITDFIKSNTDLLRNAGADDLMIQKIHSSESLTFSEIMDLKYYMASNLQLDLLMWGLSDADSNEIEIPKGAIEYCIVQGTWSLGSMINLCTKKILSESQSNVSDLFEFIMTTFEPFESPLFEGIKNPLKPQIELMKDIERKGGTVPSSMVTYVNSILEYLKLNLVILSN